MIILGVVKIILVLSTVGCIVRGLDRLIEGLDNVSNRRNFNGRIDESSRDEFGRHASSAPTFVKVQCWPSSLFAASCKPPKILSAICSGKSDGSIARTESTTPGVRAMRSSRMIWT